MYHLIQPNVPVDVFLNAISFLIEDAAYFSYNCKIYRQCSGLTMGNSLSQILAEIVTSYALINATTKLDEDNVSFIYKYVDDLISGVDKRFTNKLQNAIMGETRFLKLKMDNENNLGQVSFLNMSIERNPIDNSIKTKWFQKECSAKRILDYFSSHPLNMKINVTEEYIKNALSVSE